MGIKQGSDKVGKMLKVSFPVDKEKVSSVYLKQIDPGLYREVSSEVCTGSGSSIVRDVVSARGSFGSVKLGKDKVVTSSSTGTAIFLRGSDICGIMAVEGSFKKGLANSRYSVYSSVGHGKAVNADGVMISSSARYTIASSVSDKSSTVSDVRIDAFRKIESGYVEALKSSYTKLADRYIKVRSSAVSLSKAVSSMVSGLNSTKKIVSKVALAYTRSADKASANIDKLNLLVDSYRDRVRDNSSSTEILSSELSKENRISKNADFLASLM